MATTSLGRVLQSSVSTKALQQYRRLDNAGLIKTGVRSISTTITLQASIMDQMKYERNAKALEEYWFRDKTAWSDNNNMMYEPLDPSEGVRPAEIYFGRTNIRYSAKKMYHVAHLVRNMNVDDAIGQLEYINNKAAITIRDVLLEAQEFAVKEQNVEFKSNMHIVESFADNGMNIIFPIFKRGASRGRCRFCNYYLMLREGPAPPRVKRVTAEEMAMWYLDRLRKRTIRDGL